MSRRSFASTMTGVSDEVRNAVELDLLAATRGPAAVHHRLERLTPDQVRARYRALLSMQTYPDLSPSAAAQFDRAEAADERRQTRRGGNR